MDYTSLLNVKEAMDGKESTGDAILSSFITRASRYLDKLCTSQANVADYFKLETVTDEVLTNAVVDYAGRMAFFPHKPITTAISALSHRYSLKESWVPGNTLHCSLQGEMVVFEGDLSPCDQMYVKVTYTGGLGATLDELPKDLVDIATLMSVRLYKEARSGLGDAIGVAELGTMIYTKAFPQRVIETLGIGGYARIAPWT